MFSNMHVTFESFNNLKFLLFRNRLFRAIFNVIFVLVNITMSTVSTLFECPIYSLLTTICVVIL